MDGERSIDMIVFVVCLFVCWSMVNTHTHTVSHRNIKDNTVIHKQQTKIYYSSILMNQISYSLPKVKELCESFG